MTICKNCGNSYSRIATHWTRSSTCSHPPITDKQREIITGILMGDAWINRQDGRNPKVSIQVIKREYLEAISEEFPVLGKDVRLVKTAKESARENVRSGFSECADESNYSDVYHWDTMRHPELDEFEQWYDSGDKVWPEDIQLSKLVLKHWYCCDGHWDNSGTNNRINIAASNECNELEKIDKLFHNAGLPTPSTYNISYREDGSKNLNIFFTVSDSKELWEYMGKPVRGFEYKWPEQYR